MKVFADERWYLGDPTPESTWKGVLRAKCDPQGPASRPANAFVLFTDRGTLDVYAPLRQEDFASLLGAEIVVQGKLVDLTAEGFGSELWVGQMFPA
jgi:hypothetical protein